MWAGEPQDARVGKLKELRLEMWKRMHIPVLAHGDEDDINRVFRKAALSLLE